MKLLHVYAGNLFGGIETLLVTLAKERSLCPQMEHHFALCFEGRLAAEVRNCDGKVHILGEVRVSRPWTVRSARSKLGQLLQQERFDAVICHACWPQAIFGSVVKSQQLPLIFWCHDVPNVNHWVEQWAKQTSPDLVIANSRYTQSAVKKLYPHIYSEVFYSPVSCSPGGGQKDLYLVPLGRISARSDVRTKLNTADDAVVIIQTSRLERWKGQTELLSALAQLRDLPGWICWIAGGVQRPHEAEYLQELQAQAQELGIADCLRFLGQRSDVPDLLAAADIFCQPNSSPEPFGIAFIEALYAKLPVVTTAIGGAVEIVDESCGRLVAVNDTGTLSTTLRSLITNPTEREQVAIGGAARAKQLCDPKIQITRLHKLISQHIQPEVAA
jgi:glycosyltransferase involved in cell wall biosynthesis